MLTRTFPALAVVATMAFASPALAQVPVTGVDGTWSSATGPTTVTGVGTDEIRWGTAGTTLGRSGYRFNPSAPGSISPLLDGTEFTLGTFTHFNNPITAAGGSITTATLDFQLQLDAAAVPSTFNQSFDFFHLETPNGTPDDVCADGGTDGVGVNVNGCADRVTFDFTGGSASFFTYLGDTYFLELLGFQVGGSTVSDFWTTEQVQNDALLRGRLTTRNPVTVPEPGSLGLLATGLLALVGVTRRRSAA